MDSESDTSTQFYIEKILDKRVKLGFAEYLIKWEGYSSDYNTWQLRDDLIEDGFKNEIDNYEEELAEAKSSSSRESRSMGKASSRSRSKTPAKRTPKKDAEEQDDDEEEEQDDAEEDKGDEEEEQDDDEDEEVVEDDEAKSLDAQVTDGKAKAVNEIAEPADDGLPVLSLFLFFMIMAGALITRVVMDTDVKVLDEDTKSYLSMASKVLETLPALLGLVVVYKNVRPTAFSTRITAALLWVFTAGMFDIISDVSPLQGNFISTESLILGSTVVWQLLLLSALTATSPASTAMIMVGPMLCVPATYQTILYLEVSDTSSEYVQLVCISIPYISLAYALLSEPTKHSKVANVVVSGLALFTVVLTVLQVNQSIHIERLGKDFHLGQFSIADTEEHLRLNPMWLLYNMLRWTMCFCMAASTFVQ